MKKALLTMAVLLAVGATEMAQAANQCKRVESFYPTWGVGRMPISSIDWTKIHAIKPSFAYPTPTGGLDVRELESSINIPALISAAHANNTKVILSIGGGGAEKSPRSGYPFIAISAPDAGRTQRMKDFAINVKNYAVAKGFDGIDIDMENWSGHGDTPVVSEAQGLVDILEVLRDTLPPTMSLSTDVMGSWWMKSNYLPTLAKHTDYIHLMTYEFTGGWASSPIAHHARFSEVSSYVAAEKAKYAGEPLVYGLPFYGKTFKDGKNITVSAITHKEAVAGAIRAGVPINSGTYKIGNDVSFFETPDLVKQKATAVLNDPQLIGLFSWEISQDTTDSNSLLLAMSTVLRKCTQLTPSANAGADINTVQGTTINLAGTATDPEGDQMTYHWEQIAGPSITLTNRHTATATFTAPGVVGTTALSFKFWACDTAQACSSDTVDVLVRPLATTNIATNAIATASSTYCSGPFPNLHCYAASRINDGSISTKLGGFDSWANVWSHKDWVQLEWNANVTIVDTALYTSDQGYAIKDYDLQYWNGSAWITFHAVNGNTALVNKFNLPAAIQTKKVRVFGRNGPNVQPGYVRVNELVINGKQ